MQELHASAQKFQAEHPKLISLAGTAFVSVGLSLVVPAAGFLLLRLAGFGAAGPVAGASAVAAAFSSCDVRTANRISMGQARSHPGSKAYSGAARQPGCSPFFSGWG